MSEYDEYDEYEGIALGRKVITFTRPIRVKIDTRLGIWVMESPDLGIYASGATRKNAIKRFKDVFRGLLKWLKTNNRRGIYSGVAVLNEEQYKVMIDYKDLIENFRSLQI